MPRFGGSVQEWLQSIEGIVPDPFRLPGGCPFHPRCPESIAGRCEVDVPVYRKLAAAPHCGVACHLHAPQGEPVALAR